MWQASGTGRTSAAIYPGVVDVGWCWCSAGAPGDESAHARVWKRMLPTPSATVYFSHGETGNVRLVARRSFVVLDWGWLAGWLAGWHVDGHKWQNHLLCVYRPANPDDGGGGGRDGETEHESRDC